MKLINRLRNELSNLSCRTSLELSLDYVQEVRPELVALEIAWLPSRQLRPLPELPLNSLAVRKH